MPLWVPQLRPVYHALGHLAVALLVSVGTAAQASPNISTVLRQDPTTENTSADELTWRLTFTEAVTHVDATDFVVSGTTASLGFSAVALDGEGCSVQWDATLSGGDLAYLNATVTLDPGDFDEDLHSECVTGSGLPCIWGCTGSGERMTHPGPYGTNDNTFIVSNEGTAPPPTPTVRLSVSPNPVEEGSSVTVTAHLSAALSGTSVTIPLVLTAGTAEAGDYGTLASVDINAGSTSGSGQIATIRDDDLDDETFTVELGTLPSSVDPGDPRSVTVTINDVDTPPSKPTVRLSVSPNPVEEGGSVTVTAHLSAALSGTSVTVPLVLTAGTAEAGDYGTLASVGINAGSTSGSGQIATIRDDDLDDETFTVELGTLPSSVDPGDPRSVTVTINDVDTSPPVNRPPSVSATCAPCVVGPGSEVRLTASASDPDDDPLTYRWTAAQGRFAGATDQTSARWVASVPVGRYAVGVQVSDGRGGTASTEVAIDVELPNTPPAFRLRSYTFELREDVSGPVVLGNVVADDPDGDALTYALARGDSERFAVGAADGAVMYVGTGEDFEAEPNQFALTVRASDGSGGEAEAEVVVAVSNVNGAPQARDDSGRTQEDRAVVINVLANDTDPDGDRLRVESVSNPSHGTTRVAADGGVEYTPARDYHGADRFTYVVTDADAATDRAAVTVTIIPVNDAPTAAGTIPEQRLEAGDRAEAVSLTVDVSPFFRDPDGDALTYSALTSNAGVATVGMAGSELTISSAGGGQATIAVTATDPAGLFSTLLIEVTVEGVDFFRWARGWRLKLLVDRATSTADDE